MGRMGTGIMPGRGNERIFGRDGISTNMGRSTRTDGRTIYERLNRGMRGILDWQEEDEPMGNSDSTARRGTNDRNWNR